MRFRCFGERASRDAIESQANRLTHAVTAMGEPLSVVAGTRCHLCEQRCISSVVTSDDPRPDDLARQACKRGTGSSACIYRATLARNPTVIDINRFTVRL